MVKIKKYNIGIACMQIEWNQSVYYLFSRGSFIYLHIYVYLLNKQAFHSNIFNNYSFS